MKRFPFHSAVLTSSIVLRRVFFFFFQKAPAIPVRGVAPSVREKKQSNRQELSCHEKGSNASSSINLKGLSLDVRWLSKRENSCMRSVSGIRRVSEDLGGGK